MSASAPINAWTGRPLRGLPKPDRADRRAGVLTWEALAAEEPMLAALMAHARGETCLAQADPRYCRYARWHAAFAGPLAALLGDGAPQLLRSHRADVVARRELLAALPPCGPACPCRAYPAEPGHRRQLNAREQQPDGSGGKQP